MADNPIKLSDLFLLNPQDAEALLGIANAIKGLSGSYKQFAKNLDTDGQKVASALTALTTQTAALKQQMGNVNLASDQERAGYAALSASLAQLYRDQQNLLAAEKGIDSTRKATTESTRVLTSELRKQQQALKDAYAAGNTEGVRTAAAEILKLKANSEDLNRALRGANSIYTAAAGSYRAMENEARLLGSQLKALEGSMGSNAAEVRDLQKRLGDVNAAIIAFGRGVNDGHANVGRYAESIIEAVNSLERQRKALLAGADALRTQAQATNLSQEQQNKLQAELAQTDAQLSKVNGELRNYGVETKQAGGATSALTDNAGSLVQGLAGAYYGINGIVTALQKAFDENIKYSDSISDVAKTTGLTIEQTNELAESLKKLNTRTSLQGLLDIAAVGGQLGVAADDIEDFTKTIDVSVQALGNDFKGGAEEIATSLGKINTVFGKQLGTDLSQNLLHIGSALNQLGAVGAATAPQLADVSLRVGAVAANAGLGLDKVLSYAAVLEEVGVSAETSGSALNRLFSTVSTKTKASFEIAKLADANLTLKDFKRLVNTDFESAIQLFLKGLDAGGTTTTRMNALLATLKLQSGEAKSAIVTLARNVDLYQERLAVANSELKTGISVTTEAALRNENAAGSWEKLKNSVSNLFTGSGLSTGLKDIIDEQRARLDLLTKGFGKLGDAIDYVKLKTGLRQPVDRGGTDAQAAATKSLYAQADAAQKLLDRYTALSNTTNKTTAQQVEQSRIITQLQTAFTAGVAVVDKDTQAVTLNTAAVQRSIDKKRESFANQKQSFIDQLSYVDTGISDIEGTIVRLQGAVSKGAITLSKSGIGADRIQEIREALKEQDELRTKFGANAEAQSTLSFSAADLRTVEAVVTAEKQLASAEANLKAQQAERAKIAANLAAISKLGAAATKDQTKVVLDDIEVEKKKKQSVADLAKAEYELQKQRLQARLTDLDRQADNPANTDAIRTDAARKAVEVRRQLAVLERNELIREAVQTNKDKINGDATTAVTRLRLQEAFQDELVKIARDGDAKQVALRNLLLNQLGELDKLTLDTEIAAAEKVRDDVNKTYDERQKAAREVAHAQIELAALVRDAEIRNALGALDKIADANAKYEQARDKASKSVKGYDSQKDIDEQDASYARLLLATETLHDKQLTSEKTYLREVRTLENEREREAIAALEQEYGETAEVLKRKAALRRKERQEQTEEEQEAARMREMIIQESFAATQAISDAYFQVGSDRRAAELDNLQKSKDSELQVAGDNAALKAKIEEDYAKREAVIKRKQAQADKEQALFNIALNTAAAVMSVLKTGGGTYYADFGISAAILTALVVAQGVAQAVAVAAKPLPNYFVGRKDGPAEFANLAEQGPELVGQPGSYRLYKKPTVGYLRAGDEVITATETRRILVQNELVGGQLINHATAPPLLTQRRQFQWEQADMGQQTAQIRTAAQAQQTAQLRAARQANNEIVGELRSVKKAIREQEYLRAGELGDLVGTSEQAQGRTQHFNRRYFGK
jgi:TP901 family phage tail tape measure protein